MPFLFTPHGVCTFVMETAIAIPALVVLSVFHCLSLALAFRFGQLQVRIQVMLDDLAQLDGQSKVLAVAARNCAQLMEEQSPQLVPDFGPGAVMLGFVTNALM